MKCYNCGVDLENNAKICAYCGFQVKNTPVDTKLKTRKETLPSQNIKGKKKKKKNKNNFITEIRQNFNGYNKSVTIAFLITLLTLIITIVFGLFIPYVESTANSKPQKLEWEHIYLGNSLPHPPHKAKIIYNSEEFLELEFYDVYIDDYLSYSTNCATYGFIVDTVKDNNYFRAFGEDDCFIELEYNDSSDKMTVSLRELANFKNLHWDLSSNAGLLPKPKSDTGHIISDNDMEFEVYINNTSYSDYLEYISKCSNSDFSLDKRNTEKQFSASNHNNCKVTVDYIGSDIMKISLNISQFHSQPEFNSETNQFTTEATQVPSATETITETQNTSAEQKANTNTQANYDTVYITPTGTRYHTEEKCAGVNAKAVSLAEVGLNYSPCKKCAVP